MLAAKSSCPFDFRALCPECALTVPSTHCSTLPRGSAFEEFLHCVQVRNLKLLGANKNRYECTVSDGQDSITGVTTTDVAKQIGSGVIRDGSVIRLTDYACNLIGTVHKLVITGMLELFAWCERVARCERVRLQHYSSRRLCSPG